MCPLHVILCPGNTTSTFQNIINGDQTLKTLNTQSASARELYNMWKQTVENTEALRQHMQQLIDFLTSLTDIKQVRGPQIMGELQNILNVIESYDHTFSETGKALYILYFADGHGEALYKAMKKDEGIRGLGLDVESDEPDYIKRVKEAARVVKSEQQAKEKAQKEKAGAGRGGGGGGGGRGRGRGNSHGGWHHNANSFNSGGRGRGYYPPMGGSFQPGGASAFPPPMGFFNHGSQWPQGQGRRN